MSAHATDQGFTPPPPIERTTVTKDEFVDMLNDSDDLCEVLRQLGNFSITDPTQGSQVDLNLAGTIEPSGGRRVTASNNEELLRKLRVMPRDTKIKEFIGSAEALACYNATDKTYDFGILGYRRGGTVATSFVMKNFVLYKRGDKKTKITKGEFHKWEFALAPPVVAEGTTQATTPSR